MYSTVDFVCAFTLQKLFTWTVIPTSLAQEKLHSFNPSCRRQIQWMKTTSGIETYQISTAVVFLIGLQFCSLGSFLEWVIYSLLSITLESQCNYE